MAYHGVISHAQLAGVPSQRSLTSLTETLKGCSAALGFPRDAGNRFVLRWAIAAWAQGEDRAYGKVMHVSSRLLCFSAHGVMASSSSCTAQSRC